MATIAERQAEPETWRYQVAAQRTYAKAKRYRFVAFIPELALASLGAVLAVLEADATWLGAAAGAWILISRLLLAPQEEKNRRLGAAFQEHFDTEVLAIPWNDALCAGSDTIYGGRSGDTIYGGSGDDWLYGRRGADVITGDGGHDVISGGRGSDVLRGGANNDTVYGGRGADEIYGGGGSDVAYGGRGHDACNGVETTILC